MEYFRNTIGASNGLDADQDQRFLSALSGSKLFTKIIRRRQKSPLEDEELTLCLLGNFLCFFCRLLEILSEIPPECQSV